MMRFIKIICVLQVISVLAGWQNAAAQKLTIDGDTIYVHEWVEQAIRCIAEPSRAYLDSNNSKEYIVGNTGKSITITATSKNTKPATLSVQEAQRLHKFIVVYSESALTPGIYDISSAKKLEEKYNDFERRKLAAAELESKKKANEKNIGLAISEADSYYNSGKLEQAQQKYQEIIQADPANQYAQGKIRDIASKIAERDRGKYYTLGIRAKDSLKTKNYAKALEYIDEALKINPDNNYAKGIKDDIIKARDDDWFQSTINNARKAITAQNYDVAKKAYDDAKKQRPNDLQLKKIEEDLNKLLGKLEQVNKEKELKNQYDKIIGVADLAYKAEDYEAAKEEYTKATALFKNEAYPKNQLKLIDKKLAELARKQKDEKARQAEEQRINTNYYALVEKGDVAMGKGDYTGATGAYKAALLLKPAEQSPKDKLEEIKIIVAQKNKEKEIEAERARIENENKKNYNAAISKAKSFEQKNDLENARIAYVEALTLNPTATEIKQQLAKIDSLLIVAAAQKILDDQYANLNHLGDSALGAGDFTLSLENYQKAKDMRPTQTYPRNQIKAVERRMQEKVQQEKDEAENRLTAARNRGRKAKKDQKWLEAEKAFREVLELKPGDEDALRELKIIQNQIGKDQNKINPTPVSLNESKKEEKKPFKETEKNISQAKATEVPVIPQKDKKVPAFELQVGAFPYDIDVLKNKYPTIDFTSPPREQKFSQVDDYKEYYSVIKDMLNEGPRLNIQDSANNIKLIVQSVSIKGASAYIKVLIQNGNAEDFLLGPMLFSWHKKNGNTTKLYPASIYPTLFPVIAPGKEYALIYVSRDANISDEESLSFELGDREKKTNLLVSIPGTVYNSEKKRL